MSELIPSTVSVDLIEQLLPIRNDPGKLLKALEGQNIATIGGVVAVLLDYASAFDDRAVKGGKPARNRPPMPVETFEDVVAYLDRDTLDSMQLACRFMLDFIRDKETNKLALRSITEVNIGKTITEDGNPDDNYWLPISDVYRREANDSQRLNRRLTCMPGVAAILRLSYCKQVSIDLAQLQRSGSDGIYERGLGFDAACGVLLGELNAKHTSVGSLSVEMEHGLVCTIMRCIGAFKSVNEVRLELGEPEVDANHFDEDFFDRLARSGVRSFEFDADLGVELLAKTALTFGFAAPTTGGERRIAGIYLSEKDDLLAEIRMEASQIDGNEKVDFKFKIVMHDASWYNIDPTGFETYQKSKRMWVFDDLPNKVIVEIKETNKFIKIHAYSSD